MRRITSVLGAVALATLSPGEVSAKSEVELTMTASPQDVSVGDTFRLDISLRVSGARVEDVQLPDLTAFEITSRQTSRPFQFSFSFGSGTRVESTTMHSFGLRAFKQGTYTIKPAEATVDGHLYRSNPVTIRVRPGVAPSPELPDDTVEADASGELSGAEFDARAFLRTVVEPSDPYRGQQVDVTVYLYSRARMSGQTLVPSAPSMDGFWVHNIPISSLHGREVLVRGVPFRAYVIQRAAIFPQRAGNLTIGAPKVTFDASGGSFFATPQRVERTGIPIELKVKPLPPGPSDPVVGSYQLRASLDRATVKTGDAVTLKVTAMGRGNIQDLRLDLAPIEGVRILQPSIVDEQRFDQKVLVGERTWEWILIAEAPGEHQVPALQLNYFDPETESYGQTQTETLSFRAVGQPAVAPRPKEAAQEPLVPTTSFGPIRTESALVRALPPVRERAWFRVTLAIPPFFFLLLALGTSASRRRRQRRSTSGAVQRRLLQGATESLEKGDARTFYDRIVASITHALDSRLGERVGGLSHGDLRAKLERAGLEEDLVGRIINELEGADFARFAASGVSPDEMRQCLARTSALVERIYRVSGGD